LEEKVPSCVIYNVIVNLNLETKKDADLVLESLKNKDAFGEIINRYQDKLARYISRRANVSKQDIEDLLQNIFIKTYLNLNNFDQKLKFSSWIYRITHNEVVSWYRKQKIRPQIFLDDENNKLENFIASEIDIEKEYIQKDLIENIKRALPEINEKYREVIMLRFFEEKDYGEISDILEIPAGTVATRISRGKKELEKIISDFL